MKKIINILCVLLVCQLALALFLALRSDRLSFTKPDQLLLTINTDTIEQVRISERGDDKTDQLLLSKKDGKWQLPDHESLPVNPTKMEDFLTTISSIKVGWPAATTLIAARQFDLGSDNWQKKLEFIGSDKKATALLIGSSPTFKKVYARIDGENVSHVIDFSAHELSVKMDDWFDRKIARVDRSKIKQITLGDISLVNIDGDLTISSIPDGKEAKKAAVSELVTRLTDITVQKSLGTEEKAEFVQKQPVLNYTIELMSGENLLYNISAPKDSQEYILKTSNLPYYFAVPKSPVDQSKGTKLSDLLQDKETPKESGSSTDQSGEQQG